MKQLNLRWIFLIGLLGGSVLAEDVSANQPDKKFSAADLFNLISNTSPLYVEDGWNDGLTPAERWKNQIKENGLKDLSETTWNIVDKTGELRVSAYFLKSKISFFVSFFPIDQNPMPAPILSALISKAESTSTDEASIIELMFPSIISNTNRHRVSKRDSMQIRLQNGVLVKQSKSIECTARIKE